ncbi:MAG: family transporter [Chitinophagaceae bacterium]|nr:family transporter [Chitinophagaceae bacterium]
MTLVLQQPRRHKVQSNQNGNELFPVFLKAAKLRILIIGGGNVALEKLSALLNNSPEAQIHLVAPEILDVIRNIASYYDLEIDERLFHENDIINTDIIISAVNDEYTSIEIRRLAKYFGKLINVADQPSLCDFYLGSIVQKGNLKIAISTNGQSPTIAKRLKEVLNEIIPSQIDDVLTNMNNIRNGLKDDFAGKVKTLNQLTSVLVEKGNHSKKIFRLVLYVLAAAGLMVTGHILFSILDISLFKF